MLGRIIIAAAVLLFLIAIPLSKPTLPVPQPAGSATLLQLGKSRTEANAAACADHQQVAEALKEVPLECLEITANQGITDSVRYCLQRHKTKLALVEDNTEAMRLYTALQRDAACSQQKQKASP